MDEEIKQLERKYLETVNNTAEYAIEYSYQLIDILKNQFKEKINLNRYYTKR